MSELKRYSVWQEHGPHGVCDILREDPKGDYVKFADVEADLALAHKDREAMRGAFVKLSEGG